MQGTASYEKNVFFNPTNRYTVMEMSRKDLPFPNDGEQKPSGCRKRRFTAVGYDLPRTSAVEVWLEGNWKNSKYGYQFEVEQWTEIVPQTTQGIRAYLGSELIKGIGPRLAQEIVDRFGLQALEVLEKHPEQLLQIRGITESRLEDIRKSYAESRALRDMMSLLAPFQLTPKTAMKIYEYFGPASVEILRKSPYELCRMPGFSFKRVDAIVRKTDNRLHEPQRIRGALNCALEDARNRQGHMLLPESDMVSRALSLLNAAIPVPQLRLNREEIETELQNMVLHSEVVSQNGNIFQPKLFDQEDTVAHLISERVAGPHEAVDISGPLERVKQKFNMTLSEKQEEAVRTAFRTGLSIITGSPGTGKTTVLKTIIEVYKLLWPNGKISLMAPTGRASRRMAESTGMEEARTLHSALGLGTGEEPISKAGKAPRMVEGDLVIVDETSMVDMWLAYQLFSHMQKEARVILVGDPDQLPSVGAGNFLYELIRSKAVPVTVLDRIFRQVQDSLISYNARFINSGSTQLYYGGDFQFVPSTDQEQTASRIMVRYLQEVAENGIESVQILSPFRTAGDASSNGLNQLIREHVNPYRAEEEEIKLGGRSFRVGDRIMQTKNTEEVSNGDLGFIRGILGKNPGVRAVQVEFNGKLQEYDMEDLVYVELAYATTIHKAMGSEYGTVMIPVVRAHSLMWYRNLLYTAVTRAKRKVILVGEKTVLFMAIHRSDSNRRNTQLADRIAMYTKILHDSNASAFYPEELKIAG